MNLDMCTAAQRESIEYVGGPLLICAGAGSGKTFTLTQRIAYALLPESGPVVGDIDEILAITFTERAASEIKARVKASLRAEGLVEQALKVDGAWISTIHGMCARILRAYALDLGIDPAFSILDNSQRTDLVCDAINEVIDSDNNVISCGSYAALFDAFPARSAFLNVLSVASMVQTLLDKTSGVQAGLDACYFGPGQADASALAHSLLLAYKSLEKVLLDAGKSDTAKRARAQTSAALCDLQSFLSEDKQCLTTQDRDTRLRAFAALLEKNTRVGGNFKAVLKEEIKAYQAIYNRVAQELVLSLSYPIFGELLALCREVSACYEQKKHELCVLDHNDLLTKTLAAFKEHPAIATYYKNRFKLVMVDEFQDTNQLQIDIVEHLAGTNYKHLCTVGDAQQSIYRFRGADVGVYQAHKQAMVSDAVGAHLVELDKNFRSHADVLAFVDRIFEQAHVFGKDFMSLRPNPTRPSRYLGSAPRVDIILVTHSAKREDAVGADNVKYSAAREIALRFAKLCDEGHAPQDMVLLLGKMTRAHIYADALREVGLECVVTGGSRFAAASEVHVIESLLEALANPMNTAALFEVLSSDMIHLSTDDFLQLATKEDPTTHTMHPRDIGQGFMELMCCDAAQKESLSKGLLHALQIFECAYQQVSLMPAATLVRNVVVRSGWFVRLESEGACGVACAANILKAIRLIDTIETKRHTALPQTAQAFSRELSADLKEAPGALSTAKSNVVKIMTIHAAKGLEFPIVALADFDGADTNSGNLVVEASGNRAYASLFAGNLMKAYPHVKKCAASPLPELLQDDTNAFREHAFDSTSLTSAGVGGQAAFRQALSSHAAQEERAEARRKLYVALTRASEAVIVAVEGKLSSGGELSCSMLTDDIRRALCKEGDFPESEGELFFGGSAPARIKRVVASVRNTQTQLSQKAGSNRNSANVADGICGGAKNSGSVTEGAGNVAGSAGSVAEGAGNGGENVGNMDKSRFYAPCFEYETPRHILWKPGRFKVFSYSSLASTFGGINFEAALQTSDPKDSATDTIDSDCKAPPCDISYEGIFDESHDEATNFGTAFHRAAQFAIETGHPPNETRLDAFAKTYALTQKQRVRLGVACDNWFFSAQYAEVLTWQSRQGEVPFFVPIKEGFMEGEIDLLCSGEARGQDRRALVVDYKTGGSAQESEEHLTKKHLLQACCYAYALLLQGFETVELRFVRVEHISMSGELQTITYHFSAKDKDELERSILAARP